MAATVRSWEDKVLPGVAYLDSSFMIDLYLHRKAVVTGVWPNKRKRLSAADSFMQRLTNLGSVIWTTPLALQELMWVVAKSILGTGAYGTPPPRSLLARAAAEGFRACRLMRQMGVVTRWPTGVADPRSAEVIAGVAWLHMRKYHMREPADAVHSAFARYDGSNTVVTCDKGFYSVDPLVVYGYYKS